MKRILFLLLLTVSVYGQNPSRFAKIQITGNTNSGTATKVNVQEANGEVNTQTINTGFNKNIGLGGSDVVGANTLLNQYSTTPVDWTATAFYSGQVVFYAGKQWIANMATVAGDVPSVSSKWEEITFEALANKTTTVDQTIIDGSTNAVAGNAVFDGLAGKANLSGGNTFIGNQILPSSELQVGVSATNSSIIYFRSGGITAYGNSSTTNKSFELSQGAESQGGFSLGTNTVKMYMREGGLLGYSTPIRFNNSITSTGYVKEGGLASQFLKADGTVDSNSYALSSSTHNPLTLGTANGLSLSNQQLSLGLASSSTTGALSGTDWNTFNNKENAFSKNTAFNKPFGITAGTVVEGGTLGSNAYNSTAYLPLTGGSLSGYLFLNDGIALVLGDESTSRLRFITSNGVNYIQSGAGSGYGTRADLVITGNYGGNETVRFKADGTTIFSGTVTASPATTANQVPTWGQVQAASRPYKVYVALFSQSGINAPVATVLENTTGLTMTWSRTGNGLYSITPYTPFATNKAVVFLTRGTTGGFGLQLRGEIGGNVVISQTNNSNGVDGLSNCQIEIRIYP